MRLRLLLPVVFALGAGFAHGQTYLELREFGVNSTDGQYPEASVTFDSAGNMYGTAQYGGLKGQGLIWEITKAGIYKDLHDFGSGTDGQNPQCAVARDSAGNMFGTAFAGGLHNGGIVWEITNTGVYKDVHDFGKGTDGAEPIAGVTIAGSGHLYGTTFRGGLHNGGIVWEIDNQTYQDLHDFEAVGGGGQFPYGGVALDAAGNLYGTAVEGGLYQSGIVWEIKNQTYKQLHDFGGYLDGVVPNAGVTFDVAGDMYGTTAEGGAYASGQDLGGTIWEITKEGAYKVVHSFGSGTDGQAPESGITIDASGNLFGTTEHGGINGGSETPNNYGMVWEITAGGAYSDLHDFGSGADGLLPDAAVTFDAAGNMYGTAAAGGSYGFGVVWLLARTALSKVTVSPSAVTGGTSLKGTVTLSAATPVGLVISLNSNSTSAKVPTSVNVPSGGASATFAVTTSKVSIETNASITAVLGSVTKSAGIGIYPPPANSVSLSPSSVLGGGSCTGTVTLASAAPTGGVAVSLSSSSADATVPSSVTVAAGATSATFRVTTVAVGVNVKATISATDGQVTKTATLTIETPTLTSVSASPATVVGGTSTTGTVTISGPAPSAGISVTLSSSSKSATVPGAVVVAAGKSTATFTVKTIAVKSSTTATISAKLGSVTKTALLTINP